MSDNNDNTKLNKYFLNKSINNEIDKELEFILKKNNYDNKTILVLSGGGVKGIAHIGAMKALEELGHLKHINIIAGTSVGALIGCLYNIGYTPDELHDFLTMFDINKMKSVNPRNMLKVYGIDDGSNILVVLRKMFISKKIDPDITFKNLYKKTNKKLIVTTSCINDKKIYYLSYDTYPDMKVIDGVRMSISVPIYFSPVIYDEKMFIDGGCIDNYPINLFKNELNKVIGVYVTSTIEYAKEINNLEDYLMNTIQCLFEGVACNSLKGFEKQSIKIELNQKHGLEFDLSNEKKTEMYMTGYNSVINSKFI